jgi:hypothetical protein
MNLLKMSHYPKGRITTQKANEELISATQKEEEATQKPLTATQKDEFL